MTLRHRLIDAGLTGLAATHLHRVLAPLTRGRGAILMFHHVRPFTPRAFAPNQGLEVTPQFLDTVLTAARAAGYRAVPLDEVPSRLAARAPERFIAITFDDGYRDNLDHALPVLERHAAPCTVFVTTGFAERTARLWWVELEELLRERGAPAAAGDWSRTSDDLPHPPTPLMLSSPRSGRVEARTTSVRPSTRRLRRLLRMRGVGDRTLLPETIASQKAATFARLAADLMRQPADEAARVVDALGGDPARGRALVDALCLDWPGVAALARHPLVTIGGHTATHSCLAALGPDQLAVELSQARLHLEARIGRPVTQLAYPYGSAAAAGPREFTAAADAGYTLAVTTRPGVLHPGHAGQVQALPRLSVNGRWQSREAFEVLLSGVPFALWNRGRLA